MKKLILIILLFASPVWATSVSVCDSGGGCNYTTIATALAGVGNGNHTITVQGTYTTEAAINISQSGTGVGTELLITASGTQRFPDVTISGSYIKINGFNTLDWKAAIEGNYNIVNSCQFRQTNASYGVWNNGIVISGDYNTISNSTFRNMHYRTVAMGASSSYTTISGNTIKQNCNGSDMLYVHGNDHTISQNVMEDNTVYGIMRQDGEAIEVGECRSTVGTLGQTTRFWEATVAGTTGTGEPANFELTTLPAVGSTLEDGGVTWTARAHSGQHPDIVQTFGDGYNNAVSYNVLFERNSVYHTSRSNIGADGSWGTQLGNITADGSTNIRDWTFRNNLLGASRALNVFAPGFKFHNNTFVCPSPHVQSPIATGCGWRVGCASDTEVKNNILIGCGDAASNPNSIGWYNGWALIRPRNTAVANASYMVPTTYQGYRFQQTSGGCTTADTTDPAQLSIASYSFTADVTAGSPTLTNVSSFDGIEHYMWLLNDAYVSNYCYIDSYDAGAGTITMKGYKYTEGNCGMVSSNGVSFTAKPNLNQFGTTHGEKLSNPLFDWTTDGWTATDATLEVDASGKYGKALKLTATADNGKAAATATVSAATEYAFLLHYKNTAGDAAKYGIYDVTNSGDIIAPTALADSTAWSEWKKVTFTTPAGCTSIRVDLIGASNGDIVWFDNVSVRPNAATTGAGSSRVVVDGTCMWMGMTGMDKIDADYNFVSKNAGNAYAAKTLFTGAEVHGINGGNPYFADISARDYRLTEQSTILIGAGTDLSAYFTGDYVGTSRGAVFDIGAYEYQAGVDPPIGGGGTGSAIYGGGGSAGSGGSGTILP